jgi:hypothetical protein
MGEKGVSRQNFRYFKKKMGITNGIVLMQALLERISMQLVLGEARKNKHLENLEVD